MIRVIFCKGRYSIKGKIKCVDSFEYIGEFGDKELVDHMNKEKDLDCKQNWWTGFDVDQKFDNLQSKVAEVRGS